MMNNLEKACILSSEEWINSLPELSDIPEWQFSEEHTAYMNNLLEMVRSGNIDSKTK